jgi:type II secretory pathway pseudopilin PulG
MKQNSYRYPGFTLLETLLVVTMIIIVAGGMLVVIRPNQRFAQARNNQRRIDIQKIESAITQYRLQEGEYPPGIAEIYQEICATSSEVVGGLTDCQSLLDLRLLIPTYLESIPQDENATGINSGYSVLLEIDRDKVRVQSILAELNQIIVTFIQFHQKYLYIT